MTKKKPTSEQYLQNILIEKEALVVELRTRVDKLQEQLSAEIMRSAQWENRFDRMLRIMAGDVSTNDTKWRDVIQKIHSWAVPPREDVVTRSYNRNT